MPVASTLAATDPILSKISKSMMRIDELLKSEAKVENPLKFVHEAFFRITPPLGTKDFKVKKKFIPIPATLTETQQWTKAADFIWEATRNRLEESTTERLAREIMDLHNNEGLAKILYDEWMEEAEESKKHLYLRCRAKRKYAIF
ncbi:hypothetical protein Gasu2_29390 [Galdieria sulphuraria]|nr:hypothetical protein Gasu2_29390 [Galdieria sulphuraria]